jgi:hypothetical protein
MLHILQPERAPNVRVNRSISALARADAPSISAIAPCRLAAAMR